MNKAVNKIIVLIALIGLSMSGCATIVGEKTQLVPISSTPSEAEILITDETGYDIFKGITPTTVTLPKSDGSYFGKKNYAVKISKPGYATQTIPVTASANGWYLGGNFLFGGLIGWFIVDPLNGGMYTLSPEAVLTNLDQLPVLNNDMAPPDVSAPSEPVQDFSPELPAS